MHAPFILQVFATHLNSIIGAEDVPSFEAAGCNEDSSIVNKYPPSGALALAATAVSLYLSCLDDTGSTNPQVERTLRLWANGEMGLDLEGEPGVKKQSCKPVSKLNPQTGVVSNAASNFSAAQWGPVTRNYVKSIEKMRAGSLADIVRLATPFMSPSKVRRQVVTHHPQALGDGIEDEHAFLVDEWYLSLILLFVSLWSCYSLSRYLLSRSVKNGKHNLRKLCWRRKWTFSRRLLHSLIRLESYVKITKEIQKAGLYTF